MTQAIAQSNLNELLADCGTIDAVSWQAPRNMTYDQWSDIGRKFQHISGSINWWLGDWLNEGERRYGETYTQAIELTGHRLENLQQYKYVSDHVKTLTRVKVLTWTHHRYVAHLPETAQAKLLQFAGERSLSSRELLDAVRDYEAEVYKAARLTNNPPPPTDEESEPVEREKRYTIIDEDGIEETVVVKPGEELAVVSVDPPKATAYNNHAVSDDPDYDGDEWYTPIQYIEAARAVMGGIDLDPASCHAAQEVIRASNFLTKEDDSLRDDCQWMGRVWLNPPYSTTLIKAFVHKLINQYDIGNVEAAVIITNNSSDAGWFHELLARYPACFTRGRVSFWRPNREDFGTRQGQTIFYLGTDEQRFVDEFSAFGKVVKAL